MRSSDNENYGDDEYGVVNVTGGDDTNHNIGDVDPHDKIVRGRGRRRESYSHVFRNILHKLGVKDIIITML